MSTEVEVRRIDDGRVLVPTVLPLCPLCGSGAVTVRSDVEVARPSIYSGGHRFYCTACSRTFNP